MESPEACSGVGRSQNFSPAAPPPRLCGELPQYNSCYIFNRVITALLFTEHLLRIPGSVPRAFSGSPHLADRTTPRHKALLLPHIQMRKRRHREGRGDA